LAKLAAARACTRTRARGRKGGGSLHPLPAFGAAQSVFDHRLRLVIEQVHAAAELSLGIERRLNAGIDPGDSYRRSRQEIGLGPKAVAAAEAKQEHRQPLVMVSPFADLLPAKAIIRAEENRKLTKSQAFLAAQAKVLLQAFAKVGLTALIDEATGFQDIRSPDALRILVQQYIAAEMREWEKQFPDEYYDRLNDLYGSKKVTRTSSGAVVQNRPQHFAHFTRQYVYHPLANGAVLEELDRINPKIDRKGTRKARFHQHLSQGYGIEKLKRQMQEVMTLVAVSDSVAQFKKLFQKRFPQQGDQLDLGFD